MIISKIWYVKIWYVIAIPVLFSLLVVTPVSAQGVYTPGSIGIDVSWPNCGVTPPKADFGIVGVTDGLGYSQNPCLAAEASSYTHNLSLYVNTGWYAQSSYINPNRPYRCLPIIPTTYENCLAYNYGYNAGLYAAQYAASQGLKNQRWWLDVETANTWSTNTMQNRESLMGEYDALQKSGTVMGVYSTTAQWDSLTGSWRNGWSNWGATTVETASSAATYCTGHAFTGGKTLLIQYTPQDALDHDVAC